jgi:hypothetical protein
MKTIRLTIRLMICLPQVWIALVVIGAAIVVNGQEPFVDIATYAIQRLF